MADGDKTLPFIQRNQLDFENTTVFGLSLDIVGNLNNTVEIRGFTKSAAFRYSFQLVGDGSKENYTFELNDIPVMISMAMPSEESSALVSHAVLYLTANGDRMAILCQGMLGSLFGITWPHSPIPNREQSEGMLATIQAPSVAVGSEITLTVPANEAWELFGVVYKLQTSATVALRTAAVNITPGAGPRIYRAAATTQAQSLTVRNDFVSGGTSGATVSGRLEIALPQRILLIPGSTIASLTTNLDVGDTVSTMVALIRRSYRGV